MRKLLPRDLYERLDLLFALFIILFAILHLGFGDRHAPEQGTPAFESRAERKIVEPDPGKLLPASVDRSRRL